MRVKSEIRTAILIHRKHGLNQTAGRDGESGVPSKAIIHTAKNSTFIVLQPGETTKFIRQHAVAALNKS